MHRHSFREEYVFSQSSDSDLSDAPTSLHLPLNMPAPVKASSPIKQMHESITHTSVEKGKIKTPTLLQLALLLLTVAFVFIN